MRDNISPEEKLLKLIRGSKTKQAAPDAEPNMPSADPAPAGKKYTYHSGPARSRRFNIYNLASAAFIISCVYLAASFFYPWPGAREIKPVEVAKEKGMEMKPGMVEAKPYEYYLEGIKGKQIFGSSSGAEPEKPQAQTAIDADMIKDINLVGIIAGENPQAIIEDKKTQKTYYVSKGQNVGAFQVEEIQEGKVTLNYMSKKFDLYM